MRRSRYGMFRYPTSWCFSTCAGKMLLPVEAVVQGDQGHSLTISLYLDERGLAVLVDPKPFARLSSRNPRSSGTASGLRFASKRHQIQLRWR